MQKYFLFIVCLIFQNQYSNAQITPTDSLRYNKQSKMSLSAELETGLKKIMEEFRNKPNTEETWKSIRNKAEDFLYAYYKKKKLIGNKPQEAYFIQIGLQTMTATDIAANKKILLAGFSEFKPSEFMIIKIETMPLKKTANLNIREL